MPCQLQAWARIGLGVVFGLAVVTMRSRQLWCDQQLRWHLQVGAAPIPKSATPERFRSNLDVFDFELDADDLARIATLETGQRIGGDPVDEVQL